MFKERLTLALTFCLLVPALARADELVQGFAHPPDRTKPRCYWYWLDGHISRKGITHDLEAMKRVGIGEAYIGIIGGGQSGLTNSQVEALSPQFWKLMEHAIREGGRVGVDIGVFNSPGWSQSGGPWIRPAQAMHYVSFLETRLEGPRQFTGKLAAPKGWFRDIAVLAFPAPADDNDTITRHSPTITGTTASNLTYEVARPFTARSLKITPAKEVNVSCALQSSDDGKHYTTVRRFTVDRHRLTLPVGPVPLAPVMISFPAVTARFFRLEFSAPCPTSDIELSAAARVERYEEKQLDKMFQDPQPPFNYYHWPEQAEPRQADLMVRPAAVRNISKDLSADGTLRWDVPPGKWIVLRAVARLTGTKNSPAPPEATGLEVDKMSRSALRAHFNAYVGKLLALMPARDRKALKHVVADSYETGPENWTPGFAAAFQKRYGYDPRRFLPVMTGRIVGSADESDRFLWDLRRMVADRIAHDYVGGLRDLSHEHGLRLWLENYGHWGFSSEFLEYGGNSDEVSGEFWINGGSLGSIELRDASSAAHIYGKRVVYAESFTTGGPLFTSTPWSLKPRTDWAFCQGINRTVLHVYIEQPWDNRRPGVDAWFGTDFNRNNTWFDQAKSWIDYLRRCSFLLQQGRHVADVAYYIGEDCPKMTGERKPALPPGYDFDYINADVIEHRLTVKNGRFVLPDGTSYRLLVLPDEKTMRPAVLRKLRDLILAGGAVLGPEPTRSPSLQDYPDCDAEVRRMAAELWGHGRVMQDTNLQTALDRLHTPPDLAGVNPTNILFTHRRTATADIYFLSNQSDAPADITPTFRVGGRAPALWHPDTGRVERLAVYAATPQGERVPIHLSARGSVFVVFRGAADADPITSVSRNGRTLVNATNSTGAWSLAPAGGTPGLMPVSLTQTAGGTVRALVRQPGKYQTTTAGGQTRTLEVQALPPPLKIAGAWTVRFPPGNGIAKEVTFNPLESWTKRAEPAIHYFSGTATYQKRFEIPADRFGKTRRLYLDLGQVDDLVQVILNGRNLGTLWKEPFRLDVTRAARPGSNELKLRVVNVWHNRLVGQKLHPQDFAAPGQFKPWASFMPNYGPNEPLFPSGLLGPVLLYSADRLQMKEP